MCKYADGRAYRPVSVLLLRHTFTCSAIDGWRHLTYWHHSVLLCELTMVTRIKLAKWILIGAGVVFMLNGLVVGSLHLAKVIPASYGWLGPLFLTLGLVGLVTAWWGLRSARRWPLAVLALAYIPWTVIGLIGDSKQGYWPLVAGEAVALVLVSWALIIRLREAN